MPPSTEQAALAYRARGWSVIPIRRADKRPALPWQLYQEQPAGEDEIRGWFRRWPDANVAIVTGRLSGLVVLDVDPGHGGEESLRALVTEHGRLPATVQARTGGGGRHLYFRHPGGTVHNKVGLAPGIDLRGDGGLVVAPPSVHRSGRRYRWSRGCDPSALKPAPLPAWLLAIARKGAGHSREHWRRLTQDGVGEGERNSTLASLAGHLLWRGVDPQVVLELLLCWNAQRCRPPLADDEVVRTVESIVRLHEESDPPSP
ncbi:MAG TPA: bifunctional DNA primase/polymerase [Gammaproteobacteria bacterium]|nr:bifunctional DNA primase/polymerase [Gammaproteobacteria bacterium]